MKKLLTFDFGMMGDTFRGLTLIKYLKHIYKDWELYFWIRPEWYKPLKELLNLCPFIDKIIVKHRTDVDSFEINRYFVSKYLDKNKISLDEIEGLRIKGLVEQEIYFDKLIPTCEPWAVPELIKNHDTTMKDIIANLYETINQLEALCNLYSVTDADLEAMLPVFGKRDKTDNTVLVGMCRANPKDWKQPPLSLVNTVWDILLGKDLEIAAVDFQDWYPIPNRPNVVDLRNKSLVDKINTFNRAKCFVGIDGGLVHFSAACGCPVIVRGGADTVANAEVLAPYPRKTRFGVHQVFYYNDSEFLRAVENIH